MGKKNNEEKNIKGKEKKLVMRKKRKLIKNKKRKGFTLIELLAVILILGIISMIAVPTVNSVIESSKKNAAQISAKQYVEAFEEQALTIGLSNKTVADGDYTIEELEEIGVSVSGTTPDDGYVHVTNNSIDKCVLKFGNYVVSCEDNEFSTEKFDSSSWIVADNSSYIAKVYYNPTTGSKCTESDFNDNLASYSGTNLDSNGNKAQNGLKDGCMIWYAYKDNGDDTVNLILNHNTTLKIMGATSNSDATLSYVYSRLSTDTANWKVTADLVDVDDIAKIVGADKVLGFSSQNNYFKNSSGTESTSFYVSDADTSYEKDAYKYFWLMENTGVYNPNPSKYLTYTYDNNVSSYMVIMGYWTKNVAKKGYSSLSGNFAWTIGESAVFSSSSATTTTFSNDIIGAVRTYGSSFVGIRPVITLSYDVFK